MIRYSNDVSQKLNNTKFMREVNNAIEKYCQKNYGYIMAYDNEQKGLVPKPNYKSIKDGSRCVIGKYETSQGEICICRKRKGDMIVRFGASYSNTDSALFSE